MKGHPCERHGMPQKKGSSDLRAQGGFFVLKCAFRHAIVGVQLRKVQLVADCSRYIQRSASKRATDQRLAFANEAPPLRPLLQL
jgi:hypothetical protein